MEINLNLKEMFHLLEAMNRTTKSLQVLNTRSRDVLIVSVVFKISKVLKELRKGIK